MGLTKLVGRGLGSQVRRKPYMLLVVDAPDPGEVQEWFAHISERWALDIAFVAHIRPRSPIQQAVGFAALFSPRAGMEPGEALALIRREVQGREGWSYQAMRAEWIDHEIVSRPANEFMKRVSMEGRIKFRGQRYYVGQRLRGEEVDLQLDDGQLKVYHGGILVKSFKFASERTDDVA